MGTSGRRAGSSSDRWGSDDTIVDADRIAARTAPAERRHRAGVRAFRGLRDRAAVAAVGRSGFGLVGWARLAGVAVVPISALWLDVALSPVLYLPLVVWVAVSSRRPDHPMTIVVDVAAAGALTFLMDGVVSPYLLFTMVAIGSAGTHAGVAHGAVAGSLVSLSQLVHLAFSGRLGALSPDVIVPVLTLLPITGMTAGLAVRVLTGDRSSGRAVLQEANRLLVALQRVAADIPGGLDVATVSAAALAEIRAIAHPPAAIVYTGRGGLLQPAASLTDGTPARPVSAAAIDRLVGSERHRLVATASLRGTLAATCADRAFWTILPLRVGGSVNGAFLIGHDDVSLPHRCVGDLVTLAADTALALDNARLFDGAASRAADAARRRIAHDLHDSVAQSLAHIKMELELLGLGSDDPGMADETSRLARVTERALMDVRATIAGLRSAATEGGLVDALQQHVADLGGLGPTEITFEAVVDGDGDVPDELRPDIMKLAQEAISNAVRHASARHVLVAIEIDDDVIHLVVEDDGHGIPAHPGSAPGHGVGLRAMHERAAALGGRLEIRDRVGGGTVVSLHCPKQGGEGRQVLGRRRQTSGR